MNNSITIVLRAVHRGYRTSRKWPSSDRTWSLLSSGRVDLVEQRSTPYCSAAGSVSRAPPAAPRFRFTGRHVRSARSASARGMPARGAVRGEGMQYLVARTDSEYRDHLATDFELVFAQWNWGVNRGVLLPPVLDELSSPWRTLEPTAFATGSRRRANSQHDRFQHRPISASACRHRLTSGDPPATYDLGLEQSEWARRISCFCMNVSIGSRHGARRPVGVAARGFSEGSTSCSGPSRA